MSATIKAIYRDGVFKPLDIVNLKSGDEVDLTYEPRNGLSLDEKRAILERTAGAWADTIDCDQLIRDIYESRSAGSRPEPKL
ncbi:MAG: antitoxin family protein [Candidatus Acidiferrales bacterium]